MLDGVGREIAASFPGITRLGGQIVAALYLGIGPHDRRQETRPLSMDELSEILGRSKSNVFANLRALEAASIVSRHRASGARFDTFALRGKYPDVVVGAYLSRLRRVVVDKVSLCNQALSTLGDASGDEATSLRDKLVSLRKKYERFATVFELVPVGDGPIDLERLLDAMPEEAVAGVAALVRVALGLPERATRDASVGSGGSSVGSAAGSTPRRAGKTR